MKVGFVGLGRMGQGMAGRISVRAMTWPCSTPCRRRPRSSRAAGARVAPSVPTSARPRGRRHDARRGCDHPRRGARRRRACASRCRKGAIHLVMGTHGVAIVRALEAAHAKPARRWSRRRCSAAPTSRRRDSLASSPAGPPRRSRAASQLLSVMGRRIFAAGPKPESATAIKLANNAVLGCAMVAMAEGFALVRKYDVQPQVFQDVMVEGLFAAHRLQGVRPEDGRRELRPGRLADHRRPQGRAT